MSHSLVELNKGGGETLKILSFIFLLGTYDSRWRVLILYVTRVFDLHLNTVDNFELKVVNCLSNFKPAQSE